MQDLSTLSNEELVAVYRSLGGVIGASKFRTKAQGISKIQELRGQATLAVVLVEAIKLDAEPAVTEEAPSEPVKVEQFTSKRAARAAMSREARKAHKRQARREVKARQVGRKAA